MAKNKEGQMPETGEQSPDAPPLVNEVGEQVDENVEVNVETEAESEVNVEVEAEAEVNVEAEAEVNVEAEAEVNATGKTVYWCISGVLADKEYKTGSIIPDGVLSDDQINQLLGQGVIKAVEVA
jgi:hypothetical protein